MPAPETKERPKRKPNARHRDIIIAAMEERMLIANSEDPNILRIRELLDELKRSLNNNKETETE